MADTYGTWAAHLALSPANGDVHWFTDSFYQHAIYDSGAAKWRYFLWGKELTPPASGLFAWINQTSGGQSATVSHANGGEVLSTPALNGSHLRIRKTAAPSTPYTVTAGIVMTLPGVVNSAGNAAIGLCFRESGTQEVETHWAQVRDTGVRIPWVSRYTNPTTFSASVGTSARIEAMTANQLIWLQIKDDGTNRKGCMSADGINFIEVNSHSRTQFLTANEIGWVLMSAQTSAACTAALIHWKVT